MFDNDAAEQTEGVRLDAVLTDASDGTEDVSYVLSTMAGGSIGERIRIDGDGLKFNGDTAAANGLDDYEEGTWTPTFVGGSGSFTVSGYAFQSGSYTKVGRVVYIQGILKTTGVSNVSSGTYDIAGLPFNVAANLEPSGTPTSANAIVCSLQSNWTNAPQLFTPVINTTNMRARQGLDVGASTYTNGNTGDFNTGTDKNRTGFSGWYETDA